jgi:predicted aspartyl protease
MTFTAGVPIHAPVRLNGVALTLMVDTGADRTLVSPAALERAGVAVASGRTVSIIGVGGSAQAREVTVASLEVAGAGLGPLTVLAHEVGVGGVDGLLGRDVLDRFTLAIDPAAGRAVLTPR